jgi:hypothetical protein
MGQNGVGRSLQADTLNSYCAVYAFLYLFVEGKKKQKSDVGSQEIDVVSGLQISQFMQCCRNDGESISKIKFAAFFNKMNGQSYWYKKIKAINM